jgi:hypothetical protein
MAQSFTRYNQQKLTNQVVKYFKELNMNCNSNTQKVVIFYKRGKLKNSTWLDTYGQNTAVTDICRYNFRKHRRLEHAKGINKSKR